MSIQTAANDFVTAIKETTEKGTSAYDTTAEVMRVENGTAWVKIPGGIDETPVNLTVNAIPGDIVQIRVGNGTAWIVGNQSAPPTDDTKANEAQNSADTAQNTADNAQDTADSALELAENTNNHFWTDGEGAHITPQPQEEWKQQKTGGNTLLTTDGLHVRDGEKDVASFTSEGQRFYNDRNYPVWEIGKYTPQYGSPTTQRISTSGLNAGDVIQLGWETDQLFKVDAYKNGALVYSLSPVHMGVDVYIENGGFKFSDTVWTAITNAQAEWLYIEYWAFGAFPYYTIGTRDPRVTQNGPFSTTIGTDNSAPSVGGIAIGDKCQADGGIAIGQGSFASSGGNVPQNIAIGGYLKADKCEMALGKYNVDRLNRALVIGTGMDSSSRRNGFEVGLDGHCYDGANHKYVHTGMFSLTEEAIPVTCGANTYGSKEYTIRDYAGVYYPLAIAGWNIVGDYRSQMTLYCCELDNRQNGSATARLYFRNHGSNAFNDDIELDILWVQRGDYN